MQVAPRGQTFQRLLPSPEPDQRAADVRELELHNETFGIADDSGDTLRQKMPYHEVRWYYGCTIGESISIHSCVQRNFTIVYQKSGLKQRRGAVTYRSYHQFSSNFLEFHRLGL